MSPHRYALRRIRRSFTLVELVVVVVVLLVLMAIAVPAFMTLRAKSNDTSALSNLNVAHRTIATFAGEGAYADDAPGLAEKLNRSERSFTSVSASGPPPSDGDVQVAVYDEGRTAHLCVISATGAAFCLATNTVGRLDLTSPHIASKTVFRSWGHSINAASCWLPTEASGPGEACADDDLRVSGGPGWERGNIPETDPGDLSDEPEVDTGDTMPAVGFVGPLANIPEVGGPDPLLRAGAVITGVSNPTVNGTVNSIATTLAPSAFTTDAEGDIYFYDSSWPSLRKVDTSEDTIGSVIAGPNATPPAPAVGADIDIADARVGKIEGMTWGGGRLWFLDYYQSHGHAHYVRVLNPTTGKVATLGEWTQAGDARSSVTYVPESGSVFIIRGPACATQMQRFDVAAGTFANITLPDGWKPCVAAYDHATKRLIMSATNRLAHLDVHNLFAYDAAGNTLEYLVGGTTHVVGLPPRDDELIGVRNIIVTTNGNVLLAETAGVTWEAPTPTYYKGWVRQLDRATGTLRTVYASPGTGAGPPAHSFETQTAVDGTGRLYFTDRIPYSITRVSLMP